MARDDWDDSTGGSDPRNNPGRPGRDDFGDAPSYERSRPGMSGGMKLLLILLAVIGFSCLACCGGIAYLVYSIKPEQSTDAAKVDAVRNEIATINLLPGFKPKKMMKMDNFAFSMEVADYENPTAHGEIAIMQFAIKMGGQNESQMRQQMRQSGISEEQDLQNSKSERKEIKIKGAECPFDFTIGENPVTKKKVRQVTGSFQGKEGGIATLIFSADADAFTEEQIIKMLEGIQ